MAASSRYRGHEISHTNSGWVYTDTKEPTVDSDRPCGYCGGKETPEGHDKCLGTLPGLMNACCGHGQPEEAYVQFLDATVINGNSAKIIIKELKKIQHSHK